MPEYTTVFGSLDDYPRGTVIVIDDDPKAYVFSNVFEVANASKPYEKVAVGKNLEYVLEVIDARNERWRVTPHDEFVGGRHRRDRAARPRRATRRPGGAGVDPSMVNRRGKKWARHRRRRTSSCCRPASATGCTATASA